MAKNKFAGKRVRLAHKTRSKHRDWRPDDAQRGAANKFAGKWVAAIVKGGGLMIVFVGRDATLARMRQAGITRVWDDEAQAFVNLTPTRRRHKVRGRSGRRSGKGTRTITLAQRLVAKEKG